MKAQNIVLEFFQVWKSESLKSQKLSEFSQNQNIKIFFQMKFQNVKLFRVWNPVPNNLEKVFSRQEVHEIDLEFFRVRKSKILLEFPRFLSFNLQMF